MFFIRYELLSITRKLDGFDWIFMNFWYWSLVYKKLFFTQFNLLLNNNKDALNDMNLSVTTYNNLVLKLWWDENIPYLYDSFFSLKTSHKWFSKFNTKVWWIFTDRDAFNVFYIMYKHSQSFNKYGIKKYLFKQYIERDNLPKDKLTLLKNAVLDYYTNDEDINKYILWDKNFIYKDCSEEELDILYKMWLFIKANNINWSIFKDDNELKIIDLTISYYWPDRPLKQWKIFANDKIYECFLYFYNHAESFRKFNTRKKLIEDFLEKDKIWFNSALKHIWILLDYMNSLDELFSTPFYNLLDVLMNFDKILKDYQNKLEYEPENESEYYDLIEEYWYIPLNEEFDKNDEEIYSELELEILSLFYNTDKLVGYTYYTKYSFLDSSYSTKLSSNQEWIWISREDYNDLYK